MIKNRVVRNKNKSNKNIDSCSTYFSLSPFIKSIIIYTQDTRQYFTYTNLLL